MKEHPGPNTPGPCVGCTSPLALERDAHHSRRQFLVGTFVGATVALTAGKVPLIPSAMAKSTWTPETALKELLDGNQRFARNELNSLNEDLSILKAKTVEKQEPFAGVLSCADSRVPVEFVFDQSIGHLFVVRVAGNIATPEIIASLEYGVAVLGIKVLMVLGHGSCGAVKAAIEGKEVPGQISALFAPITRAIDEAGPDLDATIDANARIQAELIGSASPIIAAAVKAGKLKVVPARYELATGRVALLA